MQRELRKNLFWQQNGGYAYSTVHQEKVRSQFSLGRFDLIYFSGASSGITLLDSFVWGVLKQRVYTTDLPNYTESVKSTCTGLECAINHS